MKGKCTKKNPNSRRAFRHPWIRAQNKQKKGSRQHKRIFLPTMNKTLASTLLLTWIAYPACRISFVDCQKIDRKFRFLGKRGIKNRSLSASGFKMKKMKTGLKGTSHREGAKLQSTISPMAQNAWPGTPKCFDDAEDATNLGSLVLESFWYEIQRTKCKPDRIEEVYDAYFREDLLVNDHNGNVIASNLQEYKEYSIGDAFTPGTVAYICYNRQKVSFNPTQEAVTEPGIHDDFVWIGNQVIDCSVPIIQERWFLIELLGASGSFLYNGKGKSTQDEKPWFYEYHTKGSKDSSQHCHRPQIYGIVIID